MLQLIHINLNHLHHGFRAMEPVQATNVIFNMSSTEIMKP